MIVEFGLVQFFVCHNVLAGGSFGCGTTNLLSRVVGILEGANPVDLVDGWLVLHHFAKSGRKATQVLPTIGIAIEIFAGTVVGTMLREPPLFGNGCVENEIAGLGGYF